MRYFFDNNLSSHLAHAVGELCKGRRHWDKAQNLVKWWPAIMDQSRRIKGGAAFRVPWRFGAGQFEQIKL